MSFLICRGSLSNFSTLSGGKLVAPLGHHNAPCGHFLLECVISAYAPEQNLQPLHVWQFFLLICTEKSSPSRRCCHQGPPLLYPFASVISTGGGTEPSKPSCTLITGNLNSETLARSLCSSELPPQLPKCLN